MPEWLALFVEQGHLGRTRDEFVFFVFLAHGLERGGLAKPGPFVFEVCADSQLVKFQCRLPGMLNLCTCYLPGDGFAGRHAFAGYHGDDGYPSTQAQWNRVVRLDRFVSQAVGISRSQARALIRRGQITVAGGTVRQPAHHVDTGQAVEHAGKRLQLPQPAYLMLHKPCGLLSATTDPAQNTVLSLLPSPLAARVHLVGRLDKDTSGLLLLTDDGAWSHRISSPKQGCAKTYRAELAQPLVADAEQRLLQGLVLRSEPLPTRPAVLQRLDATQVRITISEGRYHQVRRMFAALGNRVVWLHRERIGGLWLDETLAPGQWRELSGEEREAVLAG